MLNGLIEVLNLAREVASRTPANVVFGSTVIILATVGVSRPLVFLLDWLRTEIRLG